MWFCAKLFVLIRNRCAMRLGIALAPIRCAFMQWLTTFVCFFFFSSPLLLIFFAFIVLLFGVSRHLNTTNKMLRHNIIDIGYRFVLIEREPANKRKIKKNDSSIWLVISVVDFIFKWFNEKPEIRKALNGCLSIVIAFIRMLRWQNDTTQLWNWAALLFLS